MRITETEDRARLHGRATPWLWVLSGLWAACGNPVRPASPDRAESEASPAASSDPAARCLAVASAPRARRDDEPSRIGVKHVLVKHAEAERADAAVSRSAGEACLRAQEVIDKLAAGADFDALVAEYSDEAGAETRGGSLGSVTRDDLDPAFADAAFALDINQVSQVVRTPFGFHVILRTD